jgi:hypothetical protein
MQSKCVQFLVPVGGSLPILQGCEGRDNTSVELIDLFVHQVESRPVAESEEEQFAAARVS